MTRFYEFRAIDHKGAVLIESCQPYDLENLKTLMIGEYTMPQPFKARISEGRVFNDIVSFQDPFNLAISKKLLRAMIETELTGWKSYAVEIEGTDYQYHGLQILGRCGELKRPKKDGFVDGYQFDVHSWDGSDFFVPAGTLLRFCTERAMHLLSGGHFSNVRVEDISTIQWYSA